MAASVPQWKVVASLSSRAATLVDTPFTGEARLRFLVDELASAKKSRDLLPDDAPMTPPPGSRSAAAAPQLGN